MKKMLSLLLSVTALLTGATTHAQYTTTWVGNSFGDNASHVGNCARSMWVSPGGVIYTSSGWDENGRNIGIYQNGVTLGAMGGTNQSQGSAIGGDSTWIFAAQEAPNAGKIGRYIRSTKARDLLFTASTGTGDAIRGIAVRNGQVYASDFAGNRIEVFSTAGTLLRQWSVPAPGAIALDSTGAIWVAQMATGTISRYDSNGLAGAVVQMDASSRPSALFADNTLGQLLVGDQGPDMNIRIYGNLSGTPTLLNTFGVQGGYLDTTTGIRGQTGAQRFTRVTGIGRDNTGRLYVLNNPWGGTWDLGRNGATDIHCYDTAGALLWTLQALNFEGNASADAGTDGTDLYSGNIVYSYTGTDGGLYKANTIDPFRYPWDARIQLSDHGRGEHFGHLANVGGNKILVANNQNADVFYTYYFHPATDGYIAIPGDTISKVRNGFCLDSLGDIWISQDKTNAIQHYPLTGFAASGKPIWGPVISTPTPATIARLNRLEYIPAGDIMVLAGGNTDWTLIGNRIEVYRGWVAGNRTPNVVITLSRAQAKAMTAAGNYLFVGYYAIPNIDIFDLTTGNLVLSMTTSNSVYVGNDVDSEYGLKAYHKSTGEYLVTKDDYNATKVVLYRWTPDTTTSAARTQAPAVPATAVGRIPTAIGGSVAAPLTVYPNPAGSLLNIDLGYVTGFDCSIRVVDLSGKTVKTARTKGNQQTGIGIAHLARGVYVVSIANLATGHPIGQSKFVKE
ncbi:MAG TPA: T9SS type A sorting domain-containing protein [Puia sp.]|nr:T9SS type A sorting domain-containing protein [Puia sp.]